MVPHRGTNWAALWLTAQIRRDAVLSESYGRGYQRGANAHIYVAHNYFIVQHSLSYALLIIHFVHLLSYAFVRSILYTLYISYRTLCTFLIVRFVHSLSYTLYISYRTLCTFLIVCVVQLHYISYCTLCTFLCTILLHFRSYSLYHYITFLTIHFVHYFRDS